MSTTTRGGKIRKVMMQRCDERYIKTKISVQSFPSGSIATVHM